MVIKVECLLIRKLEVELKTWLNPLIKKENNKFVFWNT